MLEVWNYIYKSLIKGIADPYVFSRPSYAPFLSYVSLKTKFENLLCKIHVHVSQKAFELEHLNLVY